MAKVVHADFSKMLDRAEAQKEEKFKQRKNKAKAITQEFGKISSMSSEELFASFLVSREIETDDSKPVESGKKNKTEQDKAKQTKPKPKPKAVSPIKKDIDNAVPTELKKIITENTEKILGATERAIRASFILSETAVDFSEKSIYDALDMVVGTHIDKIAEEITKGIVSKEQTENIKQRHAFFDLFSEYVKVAYVSKTIQEEQLIEGNETIFDLLETKKRFYVDDGFLSTAINFHHKTVDAIHRSGMKGEHKRSADIYKKQLEALAIENLFPEDIFDVF